MQFEHRSKFLSACVCTLLSAHCGRATPARDAGALHDATADGRDDASQDEEVAPDAAITDTAVVRTRVTITATGDITLNPRLDAMADAHRQEGRLTWFLPTIPAIVTPREIALAFLETPLSSTARPPSVRGRGLLVGAPAFARDLARLGFDALSVATEHAYDQTARGLGETRDALGEAGVGVVGAGAGADEPWRAWTVERDGMRVAVVAASVRGLEQDAGSDPTDVRVARVRDDDREPLLAAVRATRTAGDGGATIPDVVVVMVHWGRDFAPGVDADRRALARALVDAGADLVLGAGPNVLQPVERMQSPRGDAVVAYSLGNLLSNQGSLWRPDRTPPPSALHNSAYDDAAREGALLRVTFAPHEGHLAVELLTAVALWTRQREDEVHVVPLRAMDEPFRTARLASIARRLGPAVHVRP